MRPTPRAAALGMLLVVAPTGPPSEPDGTGIQPRTTAAYEAYVAEVEHAFMTRVRGAIPIAAGAPRSGPGGVAGGRIVKVPRGLVHHWRATTHIGSVTLDRVVATAQRYEAYADIYASVIRSRVLQRGPHGFRVLTRVQERVSGITVVLEVESLVRYERLGTSAYSIGTAERISEVGDAGETGERLLPSGHDSGYLWRAHTFTRFVERDGGVDVELETIGLSRRFPPLLAWVIEPIARRLGRRSVERTLEEFAVAVRRANSRDASTGTTER